MSDGQGALSRGGGGARYATFRGGNTSSSTTATAAATQPTSAALTNGPVTNWAFANDELVSPAAIIPLQQATTLFVRWVMRSSAITAQAATASSRAAGRRSRRLVPRRPSNPAPAAHVMHLDRQPMRRIVGVADEQVQLVIVREAALLHRNTVPNLECGCPRALELARALDEFLSSPREATGRRLE